LWPGNEIRAGTKTLQFVEIVKSNEEKANITKNHVKQDEHYIPVFVDGKDVLAKDTRDT
jgi:hypothetical protein